MCFKIFALAVLILPLLAAGAPTTRKEFFPRALSSKYHAEHGDEFEAIPFDEAETWKLIYPEYIIRVCNSTTSTSV